MSENLPLIELGLRLVTILQKLERMESASEERWQTLNEILDKMHVSVMEQLDRIHDRLDTIETTVDNIESNMPVQEEDNG